MGETKNNKGTIWLLIILIVLVIGLAGYIVYDKVLQKENIETSNKNSTTTNNHQNNNDDNTLRRDNFIQELNGKSFTISFLYEKADINEINDINSNYEDIEEAKNNGDYVYNIVYVKILIDEKEVDKRILTYYDFDNNLNNMPLISRDSINIIKGNNEEYFVFEIQHRNSESVFMDGGVNPLIVKEDGTIIHELIFDDATGLIIQDEESLMYQKGNYIIENEKLYYIKPNCDKSTGTKTYFDQYLLEVNNDKVNSKAMGTYSGEVVGGTICGY